MNRRTSVDASMKERPPDRERKSSRRPMFVLAAVCAMLLLAAVLVGGLQLTSGCTGWRAWKASKEGQRYITLELRTPPFYCIGSRDPTP